MKVLQYETRCARGCSEVPKSTVSCLLKVVTGSMSSSSPYNPRIVSSIRHKPTGMYGGGQGIQTDGQRILSPFHNYTLAKKVERIRRIPSHGVAALSAIGIEQGNPFRDCIDRSTLVLLSTSTLLRNSLNEHSLGSFKFFTRLAMGDNRFSSSSTTMIYASESCAVKRILPANTHSSIENLPLPSGNVRLGIHFRSSFTSKLIE